VLLVGLTGGIGAGKTMVAARLAALGAVLIDADVLAREVVAPGTPGLDEVVATFGAQVLTADRALDRAALGRAVFGDEPARRRLEAIIHPRVRARTAELAAAAPPDAVVVNDVPLLVEAGLAPSYHLVIVVRAGEATRVWRLVRGRGMTTEEAYARIGAQSSDAQRAAVADVVLDNDGTPEDLHRLVDALWTERIRPYEENLRRRRPVWPAGAPVVPYDPTWPAQYARLAARISYALGPREHVLGHTGPTAVPGQAAPDIVDIELSVAEPDGAVGEVLAAAGFPAAPETGRHGSADPGRPATVSVRPSRPGPRTAAGRPA